jgi:hypothetical protein
MAQHYDPESEATERQPLIARADDEDAEAIHAQKVVNLKWTIWDYSWYTVVIAFSIAAIVVSVKAFLNAREVKVDWGEVARRSIGGGLSGAAGANVRNRPRWHEC